MKIKKIVALLLAVIVICAVATSCSVQGSTGSIVGKWNNIDNKNSSGSIIFREDGTMTIEGVGYRTDGTYTTDGDKVFIKYTGTVYTDRDGNDKDLGKAGYYSRFDTDELRPKGSVKSLSDFEGVFVVYEISNKEYLEIFYIDEDAEIEKPLKAQDKVIKGATLKWRYERSYEAV